MRVTRAAAGTLGGLLILLGLLLPDGWIAPLPSAEHDLPEPALSGAVLFQFALVVEGLVLLWLGLRGRRYGRLAREERALVRESSVPFACDTTLRGAGEQDFSGASQFQQAEGDDQGATEEVLTVAQHVTTVYRDADLYALARVARAIRLESALDRHCAVQSV